MCFLSIITRVMLFRYRGSAPLQRAILNQDQTTGVTVQLLDPNEFDAGKILAQAEVVRFFFGADESFVMSCSLLQ